MKSHNFSNNWNGKLMLPVFQDIRMVTDTPPAVEDTCEILLKGTYLGIAEIQHARFFAAKDLTTPAAYAVCGHNCFYLNSVLKRMYPSYDGNSHMVLITWQWVSRDMNALSHMIQEFYNGQLDTAKQSTKPLTLFP